MNGHHCWYTYVVKAQSCVVDYQQFGYVFVSSDYRPMQSCPAIAILGIDINVTNLGSHIGKITLFGSSMKCVAAHLLSN